MLPEQDFLRALCLERKRTERSRDPFVLALLEVRPQPPRGHAEPTLQKLVPPVRTSIRETDIAGWHKQDATFGVIFAALGAVDKESVLRVLRTRLTTALRSTLDPHEVDRVHVTLHCFPDDWKPDEPEQPVGNLYPDVAERNEARRVARGLKRGIDLLGATLTLILLAPVLAAIAIAVKLTSPGPVLFRQTRIGQYGAAFTFLKFRTMHTANDPQIHKDFVTRFIAGNVGPNAESLNGKAVYKITKDPRLTPVGGFLRRTSLDELPQLLNVLRGEMSLVGPRPPILYEVDAYDIWHRRRLLEVKPGITGLWQVSGRSKLRFDDMVRLDLRYAKSWSLWLDLKILMQTPKAVVSGEGAY
jgi:lipopolysaccharide/colanic/teichoic acid biosynthesis glycosyltransferase